MRSWLAVSAIVSLVMMGGLAVVMGISLAVNGGGMDSAVEMLEYGARFVAVVAGTIVLLLAAAFITEWIGDASDRWRGRSLQGDQDRREPSISGHPALFVTVVGILLIASLAAFGRYRFATDLALATAGLAVLAAVCWCCDKVAAKRRRWRELGSEGRWWDQR